MTDVATAETTASTYPDCPLDLADSPLVQAYCRKTPGSEKLTDRARSVFPSGITHDARYIEPYGIHVTHARGSRKWDVDGNEYVDYTGGHGALILGHNHPDVLRAVERQIAHGIHFGASHELEIQWGELIQQMVPCAERVRLTNSGTEATMLALRLARAHTGRPKTMRVAGHFHGWHDHVASGFLSHFDGTAARGVLDSIAANVVLTPPNDLEAAARLLRDDDQVAAIILEPTGSTWGQVPLARSFVAGLRQLATEHGAVLIFDEVICGFRCAPGGAQEALGITPDMTTLGKIVAGGMPGAAVVGRREILDILDFRRTAEDGVEKVFHMGTFNAIPATCAGGIAALGLVKSSDVCRQAIAYGERVIAALNAMFAEESASWLAYGTFGGFHVFLNPQQLTTDRARIEAGEHSYEELKAGDGALRMKVRLGALLHGIDIQGWPGATVMATNTDEDLEITVDAFRQTVRLLRAEGDIA